MTASGWRGAPSKYLQRLEQGRTAANWQIVEPPIDKAVLDDHLSSHCILVDRLRADDFNGFMEARQAALLALVSRVTEHALQLGAQPAEEGEELSPAIAHDSGLELINTE